MNFLDDIIEKTIIICPNYVKKTVLKEIDKRNKLINVKLYSLDELKRFLCFDYDINAILYLMDKYNYSYDVSKYYIDNLYFIEDKFYDNEKLDLLVKIKKELVDNNLLLFNNLFKKAYKNTNFIVFGYDYLDSFNKRILSNFNYKVINKCKNNDKKEVFKFKRLEDEVLFVVNKIINLIKNGIDINNIYLLNLDSNYIPVVTRLFKMFNLPIEINHSSSIITTFFGKKVFNYLDENKSIEETVEYMSSFDLNNKNNQMIYNKILNIFNNYVGCNNNFDNILKCIKHDFENTCINRINLKNCIKVSELKNNYFADSSYVFLLGFNQGSIPRIVKDEDYLNDSLKELLGLNKSNEINKLERESTLSNISSIKNITITYKDTYMNQEFYKSNLLKEEMFVESLCEELSTESSLLYSQIYLSSMLDNLIKYDEKNKNLEKYYNSLDTNYMKYDNKYNKINKDKLYKYLNNNLVLSYSTVDTFYKCQFRYYIDNILKLNKFEESFEIFIGKLFHDVLSHVYDKDFDFDKRYSNYLKDKEFSNKEKFYIDKLKKELLIICNNLKEFYNDTKLTDVFTEKNIRVDKSKDINVIFKGIVDKIMYKEIDGKTYVSIIDYKTGSADIDLYNSIYGIGMQLIIYLYLISKSGLFKDYYCVGFYLQKILNNEINIDSKKTYDELKQDNLKLYGYSTSDIDALSKFDPTFDNSKYIKGMKTSKTGFYAYTKVLDEDTIKSIPDFVDKKINEARDKILDSDFSINPKQIIGEQDIIGCHFCKYKDICFRKNEDIKSISKNTSLSFLKEGDKDA